MSLQAEGSIIASDARGYDTLAFDLSLILPHMNQVCTIIELRMWESALIYMRTRTSFFKLL